MRWERWAPWTLAIMLLVAAAGLVGSAVITGSATCDAAVSVTMPSASFVGQAVAKHGADVTFRVDELVPFVDTPPNVTRTQVVTPGLVVDVHFLGGEQFVHAGQAYQVLAWGPSSDELVSHVHTATECPDEGPATVNADGTPINTGIFTLDYLRPYTPRAIAGLVVVGVAALVVRRRYRSRHPKRTITGELVS